MIFWTLSFLMCVVGALLVLVPLGRRLADEPSNVDGSPMYRAQLTDVENRIAEQDGDAEVLQEERAEIARRLIRSGRGAKAKSSPYSFRKDRTVACLATIFLLPAIAFPLYMQNGSPDAKDVPLLVQQSGKLAGQSVELLVQKAESHLEKKPDDPRGWELLARVYERMNRPKDRARALRNLLRIKGDTPDLLADLGEAIAAADQNVISAQSKSFFERALKLDQQHRKARFYFALSLEQEGKLAEARPIWLSLAKLNPENAEWQSMIKARLEVANGSDPAPGPTQSQINDAASLSVEQRTEMIEGMVASLAERLDSKPDDVAGWQRLINAYSVLKRPDDALAALEKAEIHFEQNPEILSQLASLRARLNFPKRTAQ